MPHRDSSYLVTVTRLRELLQQEGQALPPVAVGLIERAFRTPETISTRTTDADTEIEHLVSLGLTWGKLRDVLYEEGRQTGVLWMGHDTFLQSYHAPAYLRSNHPQGFQQLLCVHTAPSVDGPSWFGICVVGTNPTSDSFACAMNLLAEIIAMDESIVALAVGSDGETIPLFPTAALERLVSKSRSKRRLFFPRGLSSEQTRLLSNPLSNGSCNDNILIALDLMSFDDDAAAVIEALRSNQCYVRLHLGSVGALALVSEARYVEFTEALSVNESIKEIEFAKRFGLRDLPDHRQGMLVRAVAANRGLHSLSFLSNNFPGDNMWQEFWSSVAKNASLKRIDFRLHDRATTDDLVKVHRSSCIAEALKRNTTLTDISYLEDGHDPVIMQEVVLPILELNRFRPRIRAIRQVPNDALRWSLFGKALLHPQLQQYPYLLFQLLLVHSDDFGTLVKPVSEAENSIARRVKRRRRLVASK